MRRNFFSFVHSLYEFFNLFFSHKNGIIWNLLHFKPLIRFNFENELVTLWNLILLASGCYFVGVLNKIENSSENWIFFISVASTAKRENNLFHIHTNTNNLKNDEYKINPTSNTNPPFSTFRTFNPAAKKLYSEEVRDRCGRNFIAIKEQTAFKKFMLFCCKPNEILHLTFTQRTLNNSTSSVRVVFD